MKVFTRDYKTDHINSPVFGEYYGGMNFCVLDIEATGLDPSRSKAVLIGLLMETSDGVRVTQFLAENHYDEFRVLQAAADYIKDNSIDYLITFNGLRYDIPFLNTRFEKNFLDERLTMYDLDIYRFLRKCSVLPHRLDSLSQKSCEAYYGIAGNRRDTITGRENVALFDQYALTGNSTAEKIILTHNREDVLQLYLMTKIIMKDAVEYRENTRTLDRSFHETVAKYGFPVCKGRFSARPVIKRSDRLLKITGEQHHDPISAAFFPDIDNRLTASFSKTTASYEISVPVECHNTDCFVDLNGLDADMSDDPDCINSYLILTPRAINRLCTELLKHY